MLWEDEVRRSQGQSCGYGPVTGSLAEQLSTEGSGYAGTAEALWCGNSWATRPLQRAHGTRLVGCLIASVCVLYEYLCQCAFVQRYAHGRLFVPRTVCPLVFLFQSRADSLFFLTQCLFPLSVRLSSTVASADPAPCSSQCVTCSPPVTFHPCLPHS